jgi:uncharacterized protein YjbJ (UPF0337 family)
MDSDRASANGTLLASAMKEKWSALTDDDVTRVAGKKDQLAGRLQERYGFGQDQAKREADEFLHDHPERSGGAAPETTEPGHVPALLPPAPWEDFLPEAPPSAAPLAPGPLLQLGHPLADRPEAESPPAPYTHSLTIRLSPRVLRWVAPVAVVALFVLLFLPWTGAFPGGYRVYSQNAYQTIWGGVSVDPVGTEALGSVKPFDAVGANRPMLFYVPLVLLAVFLVLAPLVLSAARIQALPRIVQALWRRRLELLATVAVATFLLLIVQLWMGFGLEVATNARVDKNLAGELGAARTPAELQTATIHRGLELGPFHLGRTLWLRLAVLGHVLLLAGLGLEFWLEWRGLRPLPRLDWRT